MTIQSLSEQQTIIWSKYKVSLKGDVQRDCKPYFSRGIVSVAQAV